MQFLPVVQRELLVAATRPKYQRFRMLAAILLTLCGIGLVLSFGDINRTGLGGRGAFRLLASAICVVCWVSGIFLTADCISREKRQGTLGLLFLTDLKGTDIVLGKLVSTSVIIFYLVLSCVPLLALLVLIGGVSGGDVLRVAMTLIIVVFFSLSAGMMVSTFATRSESAGSVTFFLMLAVTVVPLILATSLGGNSALARHVSLISPVTLMANALFANNKPFMLGAVSLSMASAACLLISCLFIRRVWRDTGNAGARPAQKAARNSNPSPSRTRSPRAAALLDANPVEWLVGIPGHARIVAPISLALITAACLIIWPDPTQQIVSIMCLWVLPYVLAMFIGSTASSLFLDLRRQNALELLYSTPLSDGQIVSGQWRALRQRYLPSALLILLFLWLPLGEGRMYPPLLGDGFDDAPWMREVGMRVYVTFRCIMLWFTAGWAGMFFALRTKRLQFVRLQTLMLGTFLPWFVFCIPEIFMTVTMTGMFQSGVVQNVRHSLIELFETAHDQETTN